MSRPLWKRRSFISVRIEFRIDEFALNTSSRKAMWASGSLCVVTRRYSSFSSARSDTAPNSSSGVVNLVSSHWK